MTSPPILAWPDLRDWLAADPGLLPDGTPAVPVLFVDLDASSRTTHPWALLKIKPADLDRHVVIGLAEHRVRAELAPLAAALTCTLVIGSRDNLPPDQIAVPDLGPACRAIAATAAAAPKAAATLAGLLRLTSDLPAGPGLVVESLAYSMLLAGPEFARWRSLRPPRPPAPVPAEPVLLDRCGDELRVTLNDPARTTASAVTSAMAWPGRSTSRWPTRRSRRSG